MEGRVKKEAVGTVCQMLHKGQGDAYGESPLLIPKRTLTSYRIRTRFHVEQKDKS